jgi:predicted ester cyclase
MSTEANKEIVRRYLERYVGGGDEAVADEVVAPEIVFTSPYTPEPVHGLDAFKQMIGALRASFPDLEIREDDTIAEGDLVASRWIASGAHTCGAFAGLDPSGSRFEITGMSFYRLRGGKIVEGWVNDDNLGMAAQLGLVPAAA